MRLRIKEKKNQKNKAHHSVKCFTTFQYSEELILEQKIAELIRMPD